jgi:hypothetical protein
MHQALIAITLIAGQAYLEESRITSLADLTPQKEGVITAEDLATEVASLEVSEDLEDVAAEESMEDLMPDVVVIDGKTIEIDKTAEKSDFAEIIPEDEIKKEEAGITDAIAEVGEKVKELVSDKEEAEVSKIDEKIKVVTTGLEIKTVEDEVAKKAEEKKEVEKVVEIVKAEEDLKEVEKDEVKKVVDIKEDEKKVVAVKEDEKKIEDADKKIADVKKDVEEGEKEVEIVEVKKPEVVGVEEVSIKTLLIKPKKVVAERKDGEDEALDPEQKEALAAALEKSKKEAEIIFLTDEEKLELLLEARDEMLEEREKEFVIIPREKIKRRFVQENVPAALVSTDRSLDNRHIPIILSDDDLIEIAFDAIQENDSTKLRSIVRDLKDPNIIHKQSGETALTYATKYRSHAIMKFLIYYGADLNIGNYKSDSPLHIAVNNNDEYALDLLLGRSADINVGNVDEKTPLMLAIETNQPNIVKTLVRYGADLEAVDSKGFTALDIARKHKNRNVEKFIIKTISEKEILSAKNN